MSKIILGVAGELASGKGAAASYLVNKHGAKSHRFSTILRDLLDRLYLTHSRENLQLMSTVVRQNFGEDALAKVISEDVKKDTSEIIVVDGVRRLADIKYLKELPGFKFIYIEADMKKRYERIVRRGENVDDRGKTFEEFQRDHEPEPERQIRELKNYADAVIDNNGSFEDLYKQIDAVLK